LELQQDTIGWRESKLRELQRDFQRVPVYSAGSQGILAAMLGETAIAEYMICLLEEENVGAYDFDAAEIAVKLPQKAMARRLLRKFETKVNLVAALYIAVELGDSEAVDRLLEQIIDQGLRVSRAGDLNRVIVTLMKAVPYNPALGKKLVQVVENLRGVDQVKDEVEYLAYAGMLAATLGERTYARWAIDCCLGKEKYLEAGAITAFLGEATPTETILRKTYERPSGPPMLPNDYPSSSEVGFILAALATQNPQGAQRVWKRIGKQITKYPDLLAVRILETLLAFSSSV
jgi:hypothetical protein